MGRQLTGRERDVLGFMIDSAAPFEDDPSVSAEDRRRWRLQLLSVRAGAQCGCGTCPSIELEDEFGRTPTGGPRTILTAGTAGAMLLLFIDGGELSYLELAPLADDLFDRFPPVDEITI